MYANTVYKKQQTSPYLNKCAPIFVQIYDKTIDPYIDTASATDLVSIKIIYLHKKYYLKTILFSDLLFFSRLLNSYKYKSDFTEYGIREAKKIQWPKYRTTCRFRQQFLTK